MNPDRTSDMAGTAAHPGGFQRKMKADENDIFNGKGFSIPRKSTLDTGYLTMLFTDASEVRNERALAVYNRVQHKLSGSLCSSQ